MDDTSGAKSSRGSRAAGARTKAGVTRRRGEILALRTGVRRKRRVLKTSELIAREIILDIAHGGLRTGDSLPSEASMLQQYDVGRASLREALRLLETTGLVHIRAGAKGGPVVGAATSEHLARILSLFFGLAGATYEDLTEVILLLYPLVAEVAARRKLSKAEVEALQASVERGCGEAPSRNARSETLAGFHTKLAELSNNIVWTLLVDAVAWIFVDHIILNSDSAEFHRTAAIDHKEIADAVVGRDPDKAAQVMYAHAQRMIKFYRSQNPVVFSHLIEWQ